MKLRNNINQQIDSHLFMSYMAYFFEEFRIDSYFLRMYFCTFV